MSGEIVVSETPNWLKDLEEKRERRLKAKLGHEAGAGAPCLKCGEDCPGLDLHFWRKACKICRCPKEEHDVHDDDIYGWAQFQLLGSKPNKVKTKIVLPGKNDEVELDWAPKGQKEIIDTYLKTLPPESLPIKGSEAAQERKHLLQKQIPIHDIDPALCHELNEEEVLKMEEYVAHIKKSSVGVGQIVNLSNLIKANLHNIDPQEAHLIVSRYSKGIPFSEFVKLEASLAQKLGNLNLLNNKTPSSVGGKYQQHHHGLQSMQPLKNVNFEENLQNSSPATKFKDINHPWYSSSTPTKTPPLNPQYSEEFKSNNKSNSKYEIDRKLLESTNFDPSLTPRQFFNNSSTGLNKNPEEIKKGPLFGPSWDKDGRNNNYGYENPYFNRKFDDIHGISPIKPLENYAPVEENLRANKPLKNMKDLIYSTYDPIKGTSSSNDDNIQGDLLQNRYLQLPAPEYDPNMVFNTYKHDPSIIQHEKRTPIPQGLSKYDPVTGKYIIDDNRRPEIINDSDLSSSDINNTPQKLKNLKRFDPVSGKYIIEDKQYPSSEQQYSNFSSDPEIIPYGNILFRNSTPQNYGKLNPTYGEEADANILNKNRKSLASLTPAINRNIAEDFLEPHQINIGAIKDINPEIRAAIAHENPGFEDDDSLFEENNYPSEHVKEILNNIILPECHYCKKPFQENEFAVRIDRATNVLFHAQCFKCAGCNQSLADNIYFYHKETDNVYCGRDYAKIKGYPRCSACDELIFTKEYCLAENLTFHLKHFCCFQCDTPLAGQEYTVEEENRPYCLPCYESSKAANCSTCESVIKPDEIGCQLNGIHFHAEDKCFRCIVCNLPLMGQKLLLKNEKLYCSHECFNTRKP